MAFFIDSAKETKCCFAINICAQIQLKVGSLVVDTALVHIWNNSVTVLVGLQKKKMSSDCFSLMQEPN